MVKIQRYAIENLQLFTGRSFSQTLEKKMYLVLNYLYVCISVHVCAGAHGHHRCRVL